MTKPLAPEELRKALEVATALDRASQAFWQERSRATALLEDNRYPAGGDPGKERRDF